MRIGGDCWGGGGASRRGVFRETEEDLELDFEVRFLVVEVVVGFGRIHW